MVFDSIAVYQNPATTIEAVTSRTAAQFERIACPVALIIIKIHILNFPKIEDNPQSLLKLFIFMVLSSFLHYFQ
jgi:hypothetical protein